MFVKVSQQITIPDIKFIVDQFMISLWNSAWGISLRVRCQLCFWNWAEKFLLVMYNYKLSIFHYSNSWSWTYQWCSEAIFPSIGFVFPSWWFLDHGVTNCDTSWIKVTVRHIFHINTLESRNKAGSRTEPWGTPYSIGQRSEWLVLNFCVWNWQENLLLGLGHGRVIGCHNVQVWLKASHNQ